MELPDLSNSMMMARWRYIQSVRESVERRNPDTLVRRFIPLLDRLRVAWMGKEDLAKLRSHPFYYYLVARTRFYDAVVLDAVSGGARQIVNVGCGSDTRAYRFEQILRKNRVSVLECDLPEAVHAKQQLTSRWGQFEYIEHLPLDLNDGAWPDLDRWLGDRTGTKTLVIMEGVSPYIYPGPFERFLALLAGRLAHGSQVTHDFKLLGANDNFARRPGHAERTFRLPANRQDVTTFYESLGYRLERFELGSELTMRLVPGMAGSSSPLFTEDALAELRVGKS